MLDAKVDQLSKIRTTELESKKRTLRFADDGSPINIELDRGSGEYEMNYKTGIRQEVGKNMSVTGNIIDRFGITKTPTIFRFGLDQDFKVVSPRFDHLRRSYPDDIFVERINYKSLIADPKWKQSIDKGETQIIGIEALIPPSKNN